MKLRIQEPFFFHSTRALTFVFIEKNRKKFEKRDSSFFRKKNIFFLCFQREREREKKIYPFFFLVFKEREFLQREMRGFAWGIIALTISNNVLFLFLATIFCCGVLGIVYCALIPFSSHKSSNCLDRYSLTRFVLYV